MKLACPTLLYDFLPLPEAFKRMTELGFKHADLCVSAVPGWGHLKPADVLAEPLQTLERVEEAELAGGVKIVAINLVTDLASLSERGQFEAVCRLARRAAIPVVSIQAGNRHEDVEMRRIKDFTAIARELGIVLCVETFISELFLDPLLAAQLARDGGFRITLDPAHLLGAGKPADTWGPLYGVTGHVHLWDTGLAPDRPQVPYGEGVLPLAAILAGLKQVSYAGAVTIEYLGQGAHDRHSFDREAALAKLRDAVRAGLGGSAD